MSAFPAVPSGRVPEAAHRASLRALFAEITDPEAYRFVVRRAKYPVLASVLSQSVLGFGVVAVLSRGLGAESFGRYGVALTVLLLFQMLVGFQVETGVARQLPRARQNGLAEMRACYSAALALRLLVSFSALALALSLARPLCRVYGILELVAPLRIAAISACLLAPLASFFLACIQGCEQPRRWAAGTLVGALLVFSATIVGAWGFPRWGFRGLVTIMAGAWLMAAGMGAALARGALGYILPGRTGGHMRELFLFALPMAAVPVAGFGAQAIAKSLLTRSWGPVPVGQFDIALALQQHMGIIYSASMTVLLPAWSRLYVQRRGAELLQSIAYARGALIGLALTYGAVLALAGPWVIPILFGADQTPAVPAARIMGLVLPVMLAGWVASTTAVVSGRTFIVGMANVIWFSTCVPASALLIPCWGSAGAAVAWLTAYLVFSCFYIRRARRFFREVHGWVEQAAGDAEPAGQDTPTAVLWRGQTTTGCRETRVATRRRTGHEQDHPDR